jgi:hypothetical protein
MLVNLPSKMNWSKLAYRIYDVYIPTATVKSSSRLANTPKRRRRLRLGSVRIVDRFFTNCTTRSFGRARERVPFMREAYLQDV